MSSFLELARVGDHGEAGRAQHRTLGRQDDVAVAVAQVIGGAEGRHPDDARAKLDAVLDRVRIKATDGVVERHAGDKRDVQVRQHLLEQLHDRRYRIIVILEQDGVHAGVLRLADRVHMVERARHHRRTAVAMQVDGAVHQPVDRLSLHIGVGLERFRAGVDVVAHGQPPCSGRGRR